MTRFFKSEEDALAVRQTKYITVLEAEQYDPGFPPSQLSAFQEWLEKIVKQIPEEFRDTAEIEFSSTGSYYDSHYGTVEVKYRRPETDEEFAERKADVLRRKAEYEEQQRSLAALAEPGTEFLVNIGGRAVRVKSLG